MILALRVTHIVSGVFWAGTVFFMVAFLQPAVGRAGPEGGKVMAELNRARFFTWMPAIALVNVLSGAWMLMILSVGFTSHLFATAWGLSLSIGASAAILAFLVGTFFMRPASLRMFEIGPRLATAPPEEAQALGAEMAQLQKRAGTSARWVAVLLLIAVAAMAAAKVI